MDYPFTGLISTISRRLLHAQALAAAADDDDDINLRPRDLPKSIGTLLSLGFKYKVLFIKKPKTTRGKKTPL